MTGLRRKSSVPRQASYDSLYLNPLNDLKHNRNNSEGDLTNRNNTLGHQLRLNHHQLIIPFDNKENAVPNHKKQQSSSSSSSSSEKRVPLTLPLPLRDNNKEKRFQDGKSTSINKNRILKPSSLHLCIQVNEPDSTLGMKLWDPLDSEKNVWDYSDSEAAPAPAPSWSTLPNRSLLCRPLPLDIGRCTCVIVKEASSEGLNGGGSLYSLYTNEGQGRQDRKLAVAYHRRRNGRSEFVIAQNVKGLSCDSDESLLGTVKANLIGSKYHIWDQGSPLDSLKRQSKLLLAVVAFVPTITTCTGSYRSLKAWIPKHQSMQLKNTAQIQHINGLSKDWEVKMNKTHQLFSRVPHYNKFSRRNELDFRERGRTGLRIQSSVKNFQLVMEESGRQSILQLGRVGKSKYVMDYRYPLTGYQAFSICLASIDSKLCCTV